MVLMFYSVPGYVKLPFSLSVLNMEAEDLGFLRIWTRGFAGSKLKYLLGLVPGLPQLLGRCTAVLQWLGRLHK